MDEKWSNIARTSKILKRNKNAEYQGICCQINILQFKTVSSVMHLRVILCVSLCNVNWYQYLPVHPNPGAQIYLVLTLLVTGTTTYSTQT
jgi:hypothetical protein